MPMELSRDRSAADPVASHALPKRLLRAFSHYDKKTKSPRLWRYERGRTPLPSRSPKSETRVKGYFHRPSDFSFEQTFERKIAEDIEHHVHAMLDDLRSPLFAFTYATQMRLARYMLLLFSRSGGGRTIARAQLKKSSSELRQLASDQSFVQELAELYSQGTGSLVTCGQVVQFLEMSARKQGNEKGDQEAFTEFVERWSVIEEEQFALGRWDILNTREDRPFVLTDTPVMSWSRKGHGEPSVGVGLFRSDAEVFLPVSPQNCIHLLPLANRDLYTEKPSTGQINSLMVRTMARYAYSSRFVPQINELVQSQGATLRVGQDCFTSTVNDSKRIWLEVASRRIMDRPKYS